jgi:hypothetical protein
VRKHFVATAQHTVSDNVDLYLTTSRCATNTSSNGAGCCPSANVVSITAQHCGKRAENSCAHCGISRCGICDIDLVSVLLTLSQILLVSGEIHVPRVDNRTIL